MTRRGAFTRIGGRARGPPTGVAHLGALWSRAGAMSAARSAIRRLISASWKQRTESCAAPMRSSKPRRRPRDACPADLVNRRFIARGLNELRVADIPYVRAQVGWVCVSFVTNVCWRRILGWQVSSLTRTDLSHPRGPEADDHVDDVVGRTPGPRLHQPSGRTRREERTRPTTPPPRAVPPTQPEPRAAPPAPPGGHVPGPRGYRQRLWPCRADIQHDDRRAGREEEGTRLKPLPSARGPAPPSARASLTFHRTKHDPSPHTHTHR